MPSVAIIGTRGYPSYYGGFETAVRQLAPYLADRGWDVTVYGRPGTTKPGDPGQHPRVESVITKGIENKSLSTLTYGLTSSLHAARRRPDVALVMNVANGYWLPLLGRANIPTLVNVDGIEWDRAKWGWFAKSVFRGGARMTARHGSRLVYDAVEIGRRWKSEFSIEGDFIPYGGDRIHDVLPIEPGLERRSYVLMVARFVPENTVPEFLDAAARISAVADVVIVGSSGYGGDLDQRASQLAAANPRVRWLGHLSDDRRLHSLWQHAGVYFHGHSVGGTNPALVQAMASGAPVVARDTVYNREVLGEAGSYVDPTADSIAATVTAHLLDREKLEAMSEAAITRAQRDYSWDGVNLAYEQALMRLIDAGRADGPSTVLTDAQSALPSAKVAGR